MARRVLAALLLAFGLALLAGCEAQSQSEGARSAAVLAYSQSLSEVVALSKAGDVVPYEKWERLSFAEVKAGLESDALNANQVVERHEGEADEDKSIMPVVALAVAKRDENYVRLLLDHGADPNGTVTYEFDNSLWSVSFPILHDITGYVPVSFIRILVENGGNIDSVDDKYGRTPLLFAGHRAYLDTSDEKQKKLLRFFADNGANMNAVDNEGRTLLSYLVENCRDELVRYVVTDMGVDINYKSKDGFYSGLVSSALGAAVVWSPSSVPVLLELGGEADAGELHYAVIGGMVSPGVIKRLVATRDNAESVYEGKTLLQVARERAKGGKDHFNTAKVAYYYSKDIKAKTGSCDPLERVVPLDYEEWKAGGQEIAEYLESLEADAGPTALADDYDFHLMKGAA